MEIEPTALRAYSRTFTLRMLLIINVDNKTYQIKTKSISDSLFRILDDK